MGLHLRMHVSLVASWPKGSTLAVWLDDNKVPRTVGTKAILCLMLPTAVCNRQLACVY